MEIIINMLATILIIIIAAFVIIGSIINFINDKKK